VLDFNAVTVAPRPDLHAGGRVVSNVLWRSGFVLGRFLWLSRNGVGFAAGALARRLPVVGTALGSSSAAALLCSSARRAPVDRQRATDVNQPGLSAPWPATLTTIRHPDRPSGRCWAPFRAPDVAPGVACQRSSLPWSALSTQI
jgi:hypothetical protein